MKKLFFLVLCVWSCSALSAVQSLQYRSLERVLAQPNLKCQLVDGVGVEYLDGMFYRVYAERVSTVSHLTVARSLVTHALHELQVACGAQLGHRVAHGVCLSCPERSACEDTICETAYGVVSEELLCHDCASKLVCTSCLQRIQQANMEPLPEIIPIMQLVHHDGSMPMIEYAHDILGRLLRAGHIDPSVLLQHAHTAGTVYLHKLLSACERSAEVAELLQHAVGKGNAQWQVACNKHLVMHELKALTPRRVMGAVVAICAARFEQPAAH